MPGKSTAVVNFTVRATDNCDLSPMVTTTPTSGSAFPIGTTTVLATAVDGSGNSNQCSFIVTVRPAQCHRLPHHTGRPTTNDPGYHHGRGLR